MKRLALSTLLFMACIGSGADEQRLLPDAMVHADAGLVADGGNRFRESGQDAGQRDVFGGLVFGGGDSLPPMGPMDGAMSSAMPDASQGPRRDGPTASSVDAAFSVDTASSVDAAPGATQVFPGACCGTPGVPCGVSSVTRGECCPSNMSAPSCQERWGSSEWCYCSAGFECLPSPRVRGAWACQFK